LSHSASPTCLSFCLPTCLCIYLPTHPSIMFSIYLSSICRSVYIYLSIIHLSPSYPFIFIYLYLCQSSHSTIHPSISISFSI
jgi:hypothetical protein